MKGNWLFIGDESAEVNILGYAVVKCHEMTEERFKQLALRFCEKVLLAEYGFRLSVSFWESLALGLGISQKELMGYSRTVLRMFYDSLLRTPADIVPLYVCMKTHAELEEFAEKLVRWLIVSQDLLFNDSLSEKVDDWAHVMGVGSDEVKLAIRFATSSAFDELVRLPPDENPMLKS